MRNLFIFTFLPQMNLHNNHSHLNFSNWLSCTFPFLEVFCNLNAAYLSTEEISKRKKVNILSLKFTTSCKKFQHMLKSLLPSHESWPSLSNADISCIKFKKTAWNCFSLEDSIHLTSLAVNHDLIIQVRTHFLTLSKRRSPTNSLLSKSWKGRRAPPFSPGSLLLPVNTSALKILQATPHCDSLYKSLLYSKITEIYCLLGVLWNQGLLMRAGERSRAKRHDITTMTDCCRWHVKERPGASWGTGNAN